MIIDFHTHVYPPSFQKRREELAKKDATFGSLFSNPQAKLATAQGLIEAMDDAGIDAAVIMGVGWTNKSLAQEANDYILKAAREYPGRLIGFCSVNPAWGEQAIQEMERCVQAGARGVGELHPDTQGVDITSREAMAPLMDRAGSLSLPILIHSSEPVGHLYPGKGKTTPDKLYTFVQNFPSNIIVCAHWGGGLPFYALMPEVAESLANVYFDTASSPFLYQAAIFKTVVDLLGSEKVLLGTDYPLITHRRLMAQVHESLITSQDKEQILGANAKGLLGL